MQASNVGSLVRIENYFDVDGTPINPTTVVFKLKHPSDGAIITYTYGVDAQVVRDDVGTYHVDYVPDVAGTWVYSWDASGNIEVTALGTIEVLMADVAKLRVPKYLTSADLDARIGAARVDQLFDDDGDGLRDALTVNTILVEAEDLAAASMLKAYPAESVTLLGQNDETFRGQVAWIACELASERRGEFVAEDGKGRYWAQYLRAKEYFGQLAKGQLKPAGEAQAGTNRQAGGAVTPTLVANSPRFIFAPDRYAPNGRGGF